MICCFLIIVIPAAAFHRPQFPLVIRIQNGFALISCVAHNGFFLFAVLGP